ncbi:aminoglycoside phosphotransferase family protein [Spiractinospora alimapuensis]|uniref:phosphotransferase enzyme family protein n=1 Tax=Spiractinospora alimapuensis TaxID=2820884 RepID=UPI001F42290D|nr:aminoglycoside phosphotransferase family protein [Spiractinospora alimapuensis]QVQ53371.1 aminoglycoside phosphotransferase family protein [Spiractinospora alimapuensis]
MTIPDPYARILATAARHAEIVPEAAEVIRLGENAVMRVRAGAVARIARPGQHAAAAREVALSRWLAEQGVAAVRVLDVDQPTMVGEYAVTWWEELPPHGPGRVADVAHLIRALHALTPPRDLPLGRLDPFVRLDQRIDQATTLTAGDRDWLRGYLADLRDAWNELPDGLGECVVHGDAWVGNIARTTDGATWLMDLERSSIGRPEWDLVSTAIKHTSFGWVSAAEYRHFIGIYGHDVTTGAGFETLRDIRELRMCLYFAQHAPNKPSMCTEADFRLACVRGQYGPRPWPWTPGH